MMRPTALLRPIKPLVQRWTARWPDYSRLFPVTDIGAWVIGQEMQALKTVVARLGGRCARPAWMHHSQRQCVFYGSQFSLLGDDWLSGRHRVAVAYFHGLPDSGYDDFDRLYERIKLHHNRIDRIQVSHRQMHEVILQTGIDPAKVFRIPIGIRSELFRRSSRQAQRIRQHLRRRLAIPEHATVVGSFQKDGQGWGAGDDPKLIKGPDILLAVLERLKPEFPDLHVLLTGPARGYVCKGLNERRIPFRHLRLKRYTELADMYQALDLYLVTSRQEGGPKAILESMAAGIPLVSTRVGQATDLIRHGQNAWLADVDDSATLADLAGWVLTHPDAVAPVIRQGYQTARDNDYERQTPRWREFMRGFLQCSDR